MEKAIRQAAAWRARQGHPISGQSAHHSDAGSQHLGPVRPDPAAGRLTPSVGTVGDAYANALAETLAVPGRPGGGRHQP